MIEVVGDLFNPPIPDGVRSAICITTNAVVRRDGEAVMGAGIALQAKLRWPAIARVLGARIEEYGSKPHLLSAERTRDRCPTCKRGTFHVTPHVILDDLETHLPFHIITFPTKRHWRDRSSLELIAESARGVVDLADLNNFTHVALPRPGCLNGGLSWDAVKPILAPLLDDRFVVIERAP